MGNAQQISWTSIFAQILYNLQIIFCFISVMIQNWWHEDLDWRWSPEEQSKEALGEKCFQAMQCYTISGYWSKNNTSLKIKSVIPIRLKYNIIFWQQSLENWIKVLFCGWRPSKRGFFQCCYYCNSLNVAFSYVWSMTFNIIFPLLFRGSLNHAGQTVIAEEAMKPMEPFSWLMRSLPCTLPAACNWLPEKNNPVLLVK